MKSVYGALVIVLLMFVSFIGGFVLRPQVAQLLPFGLSIFSKSEISIEDLKREQQLVLLSLQVNDIESVEGSRHLFDKAIPGTSRVTDMQYKFRAKLGIEGKDVQIEEVSDNALKVTIPDFIFIGHEGLEIKILNEDNGVLSWVTPEIDQNEMVERVLSSSQQREYIVANEETLKEQATKFYTDLATTMDPSVTLEFDFAS